MHGHRHQRGLRGRAGRPHHHGGRPPRDHRCRRRQLRQRLRIPRDGAGRPGAGRAVPRGVRASSARATYPPSCWAGTPSPSATRRPSTSPSLPPFVFNGLTYDSFGVTSNGNIVVGGATVEDIVCCPPGQIPSTDRPNNVLAPFWGDLTGEGVGGAPDPDGIVAALADFGDVRGVPHRRVPPERLGHQRPARVPGVDRPQRCAGHHLQLRPRQPQPRRSVARGRRSRERGAHGRCRERARHRRRAARHGPPRGHPPAVRHRRGEHRSRTRRLGVPHARGGRASPPASVWCTRSSRVPTVPGTTIVESEVEVLLPAEEVAAFVGQAFVDFLHRHPTPDRLAFWTDRIVHGAPRTELLEATGERRRVPGPAGELDVPGLHQPEPQHHRAQPLDGEARHWRPLAG